MVGHVSESLLCWYVVYHLLSDLKLKREWVEIKSPFKGRHSASTVWSRFSMMDSMKDGSETTGYILAMYPFSPFIPCHFLWRSLYWIMTTIPGTFSCWNCTVTTFCWFSHSLSQGTTDLIVSGNTNQSHKLTYYCDGVFEVLPCMLPQVFSTTLHTVSFIWIILKIAGEYV